MGIVLERELTLSEKIRNTFIVKSTINKLLKDRQIYVKSRYAERLANVCRIIYSSEVFKFVCGVA